MAVHLGMARGRQASFLCPTVRFAFILMIIGSGMEMPLGAASAARTCFSPGPWQLSQLIPVSVQVVA